jgi:predicted AlkP superfamily pyrophosphatase or phosphodiesterase
MFWPGSEAEIQGRRPTDWRPYDGKVTAEQRVATVLEWLSRPEEIRPRLITLYFHEADSAGHRHGVDSPETAAAVQVVDDAMAMLLEGIKSLGLDDRVNLVCVADHGMTDLDPARTVVLRDLVDLEAVQVDFNGAVAGLRPKAEEDTAAMVARLNQQSQGRFRAYEREKMPEAWHYRNHRRIPPVILVAEEGWSIIKRPLLSEGDRRSFLKATHGFPPELASMGATFVAWGPEFRQRAILPSFENVEVYGLICDTLGINPSPHDGTGWLSAQALRQPSR